MIPVLYYAEETAFTSNGIGRLSDIISALVTEERNGLYEVEFQYPITGVHYDEIQEGRIISITHDEAKDRQPFVIYRRSAPIDGIVTFNAHHIAYELQNVVLKPFTASSCALALAAFTSNNITPCRFSFWTDKSVSGNFSVTAPKSIWEVLGGSQGSILDVYGTGEWEFDKFTAKLYLNRGGDYGATIRYGKNLIDIENTVEEDGAYNAIVPYWVDPVDGSVVYGSVNVGTGIPLSKAIWTNEDNFPITDDNGNEFEFAYLNLKCVPYDFSLSFDTKPTAAQLDALATTFLANNTPWVPKQSITVDFVALWQTDEYENYSNLQRVKLCDTVSVIYPELGVNVKAKVIRTVWNALLDRYDEIELGEPRTSYASLVSKQAVEHALNDATGLILTQSAEQASVTAQAIADATSLITGGLGGYVKFHYDGNGQPTEILIMDSPNESTAVHILRMNVNGIGFSSNGGSSYSTAWTLNGAFNASYITTGILSAALLKAGVIQGTGDGNYWDLVNGVLSAQTGYLAGFSIANGGIAYDSTYFKLRINPTQGIRVSGKSSPNSAWFSRSFNPQFGYTAQLRGMCSWVGDIDLDPYDASSAGSFYYERDGAGFSDITNNIGYWDIGKDESNFYSDEYRFFYNGGSSQSYNSGQATFYLAGVLCKGDFSVLGSKNRIVESKNYGERLFYSYETPSPMFGDVGEGEIGEDGKTYVWLDPIFSEAVLTTQYQVFLQAYGDGKCFVSERKETFFIVEGEPGLKFGWELKARQADFSNRRLDRYSERFRPARNKYAEDAVKHIKEIKMERRY